MNTNNDAVELAARVGALEAILLSAPPRNTSLAHLSSNMLIACAAAIEAVIIYYLIITR